MVPCGSGCVPFFQAPITKRALCPIDLLFARAQQTQHPTNAFILPPKQQNSGMGCLCVSWHLLETELFEKLDVCFTTNLDVSKAVFIALEMKPNIFKLTRAMKVKKKVSKSLFCFQKGNVPKKTFFFLYKKKAIDIFFS